jgi:hypothetical protein
MHPAAQTTPRFEDPHVVPGSAQPVGGGDARHAGADDHHAAAVPGAGRCRYCPHE